MLGAIAGAQHVRLMAKHYGVPVVLHSDHCAKVSRLEEQFKSGDNFMFYLEITALV